MKSKRALWLAFGACCVGFVVMSCSSSDSNGGGSTPQDKGGENAGGEAGDKGGTSNSSSGKSGGGSEAQAGNGDEPTAGKMSMTDGGTPGAGGNNDVEPGVGGDSSGIGGDGAGGAPLGFGGDGAGGEPGLVTSVECTTNTDCTKGQYCSKPACGVTKGVCSAPSTAPVCGCNGVTYYSGALAATAGVSVKGKGQCTDGAVTCGLKKPCAKGETCGEFAARGTCATAATSVCWQLPATCPAERNAGYENCDSKMCSTLCNALREGGHAAANLKCSAIKLP